MGQKEKDKEQTDFWANAENRVPQELEYRERLALILKERQTRARGKATGETSVYWKGYWTGMADSYCRTMKLLEAPLG